MKKYDREAPIGVFDSGVGGLTVAREIMRQLPNESIVYFGDTARIPYGSKSKDNIVHYSQQIIRFLRTKGVKLCVIACNTATAQALDVVSKENDIPIIGVIRPGAKAACRATKNKKIGICGTEGTIRSGVYEREIKRLDEGAEVIGKACPLFVPLVEEGFRDHSITGEVIEYYLEDMRKTNIDTMILGCTHYPLLRHRINDYMGENVHIVNPAYETANEVGRLLNEMDMEAVEAAKHDFYVSDMAEKFMDFAHTVLKRPIKDAKQINIEEY